MASEAEVRRAMNTLFYGDNLDILREYIADGGLAS